MFHALQVNKREMEQFFFFGRKGPKFFLSLVPIFRFRLEVRQGRCYSWFQSKTTLAKESFMGRYVDGYVIPIKKKDIKAYKKMAKMGCKSWMKHGALDYYECMGDDLDTPYGIPFKKLCKLKANETLIFAYIVYKSKAHRNAVNKKVHKEMEQYSGMEMPFDMMRFSAGGFKVLVNA